MGLANLGFRYLGREFRPATGERRAPMRFPANLASYRSIPQLVSSIPSDRLSVTTQPWLIFRNL